MNRRNFLAIASLVFIGATRTRYRFAFRIKTPMGHIVDNVVIEAFDVEAAKTRLQKRYPNCKILNVSVK